MTTLHGKIMNIECDSLGDVGYWTGFRDARHAAAELAMKFDYFVAEMRKLSEGGDFEIEAALRRLDGEQS